MRSVGQGRQSVELLPAGFGSLARGVPDGEPGTLFVLGERGGIRVAPRSSFQVVFGRNEPDVHVCVGYEDPGVSRRHGLLAWGVGGWTLRNSGVVPVRFPGSRLLLSGHEEPVGASYTPLFIRTGPGREHLLEVRVAGGAGATRAAGVDEVTASPRTWTLSDDERLVLTALGERYLRHEAHPQPNSWAGTSRTLAEARPDAGWTPKRVEWCVVRVRQRLIDTGVTGLSRDEVGEPIGNTINHNLLMELLSTTTVIPPDLRLLDR